MLLHAAVSILLLLFHQSSFCPVLQRVSEMNILVLDSRAEIRRQILSRHQGPEDLTSRESDFLRVATDEICKVLVLIRKTLSA